MEIRINTRKVTDFVVKHKEACVVGAIALVISHKRSKLLVSMTKYINEKGLAEEFNNHYR